MRLLAACKSSMIQIETKTSETIAELAAAVSKQEGIPVAGACVCSSQFVCHVCSAAMQFSLKGKICDAKSTLQECGVTDLIALNLDLSKLSEEDVAGMSCLR